MTKFGDSSVSGLQLGRRSLLIGGLGGAAALTIGYPALTAADETPQPLNFDFDNGIFIQLLAASVDPRKIKEIAPMDVTLQMRVTHLATLGWFDAIAPYHPTAVGVYTRIDRRPASEAATNRNRNIAALHASYQVIKVLSMEREQALRQLFLALGMNPDDESEDPTTPVGIGNLAGKGVIAARLHDGLNQVGDEGRKYNPQPWADYTGYQPVNTAYELVNPSRWQPQLTPHDRRHGMGVGDLGVFAIQHFVTPQMRLTTSHGFTDPDRFPLAPPVHIDHTKPQQYKRSVDAVLEASAALTDEQKVKAEFFDEKLLGIGGAGVAVGMAHADQLDLDRWVHLFMTNSTAIHDALVATWHQKARYDTVRPFSAIRHVYGSQPVSAWGGVGLGTVHDMPADEWASYLNLGDHPEYPSGSTTLCAAEAQASQRFFGDDLLDWRFPIPAGWTRVEEGITPATDMELYWPTWSEFLDDCATSRVWGGVHYPKTVEMSTVFGKRFGDLAYEFVQQHVDGDVQD